MEQTKALNALEPFLALSKSATSPRAAVDLIRQATSAPNTFIFTELLQTPNIHALASSDDPELQKHHNLLQIFSYGDYATYASASGLPELSESQTLKLRQLSLLSLARDRANLSYAALQRGLGLQTARQVEDLVITAIYAGLLNATLDPARQAIQITSMAPLRDVAPGSVPEMVRLLKGWSDRCTSTLDDLEAQMQSIRANAAAREKAKRQAEERFRRSKEAVESDSSKGEFMKRDVPGKKTAPRRTASAGESMEVDDPTLPEEQKGRGSKRKM